MKPKWHNLSKVRLLTTTQWLKNFREIFSSYVSPQPRESYCTGKFLVGASIMGKNFLSNNADVNIEFVMDSDCDTAETFAFGNTPKVMAFFHGRLVQRHETVEK